MAATDRSDDVAPVRRELRPTCARNDASARTRIGVARDFGTRRFESDGKYRVTGISPGFVGTNFAESMTDPGVRAAIQKRTTWGGPR
jgi:hypothetical protein